VLRYAFSRVIERIMEGSAGRGIDIRISIILHLPPLFNTVCCAGNRRQRLHRGPVAGGGRVDLVEHDDRRRARHLHLDQVIDCQREIAFGLVERTPDDHTGGVVRNNFVYRSATIAGDAAIGVFDSPNTQVLHNTILIGNLSLAHRISIRADDRRTHRQ